MNKICCLVIIVICLFWIFENCSAENQAISQDSKLEYPKREYDILDIGRPSENIQGDWYLFADLNNNGQAVGYYVDVNNMSWAFKWDKVNGYNKLHSTKNSPCVAVSINIKGQILGYFRDNPIDTSPDGAMEILFPTKKKIVIWNTDNTIQTISDWSEDEVYSITINDEGTVFGQIGKFKDNKSQRYSFKWTLNTGMQVTKLEKKLSSFSCPNNSGQYAGYAYDIENEITIPYFINSDNDFFDLSKKFEKNLSNEGLRINDLQQITGTFASKDIGYETFLFSNETGVIILPNLAGARRSYSCSINNMGILVGYSNFYENRQNQSYAVIWIDGKTVINLNKFLDSESNFKVLERASLINDIGQIIGFGQTKSGTKHSFIINPKPLARL